MLDAIWLKHNTIQSTIMLFIHSSILPNITISTTKSACDVIFRLFEGIIVSKKGYSIIATLTENYSMNTICSANYYILSKPYFHVWA